MKKASTIKSKVFTGVIAAVCAVSVISTGAIIGASAFSSASSNADTAVIERRTSGSTYTLPMKGVDWNYFSDSLDVTVDCEIDFSCNYRVRQISRFRQRALTVHGAILLSELQSTVICV